MIKSVKGTDSSSLFHPRQSTLTSANHIVDIDHFNLYHLEHFILLLHNRHIIMLNYYQFHDSSTVQESHQQSVK